MAKINGLEKMSYAELADMESQIERLKSEKQNAERSALRQRLVDMAKEHGFDIHDLFGKGRKGTVAVKFRNPKNPENTWTGRGRMPRWMVAPENSVVPPVVPATPTTTAPLADSTSTPTVAEVPDPTAGFH